VGGEKVAEGKRDVKGGRIEKDSGRKNGRGGREGERRGGGGGKNKSYSIFRQVDEGGGKYSESRDMPREQFPILVEGRQTL